MERKSLFNPGQMVCAPGGTAGMVMDLEMYARARGALPEGRRPGRYFAPGCCQRPDYVTQVPVIFEDGTWDVMRPMNIRKESHIAEEKQKTIERIIQENI